MYDEKVQVREVPFHYGPGYDVKPRPKKKVSHLENVMPTGVDDGQGANRLLNSYVEEVVNPQKMKKFGTINFDLLSEDFRNKPYVEQLKHVQMKTIPLLSQVARQGALVPFNSSNKKRHFIMYGKRLRANDTTMLRARLSGEGIDDSIIKILDVPLQKNTSLQHLSLHQNAISDIGINILCNALRWHPNLHTLWLGTNHYTDIGARDLSLLINRNKIIKELNLSNRWPSEVWHKNDYDLHPHVTYVGAQYIARQLKRGSGLTSLSLADQRVRDDGAIYLLQAVQHCALRVLNLRANELTDRCCTQLRTTLEANPVLEQLILSKNEFSDDGAVNIAYGLAQNLNLRLIDVGYNKIGEQGLEALYLCLKYNHTLSALITVRNACVDTRAEDLVLRRATPGSVFGFGFGAGTGTGAANRGRSNSASSVSSQNSSNDGGGGGGGGSRSSTPNRRTRGRAGSRGANRGRNRGGSAERPHRAKNSVGGGSGTNSPHRSRVVSRASSSSNLADPDAATTITADVHLPQGVQVLGRSVHSRSFRAMEIDSKEAMRNNSFRSESFRALGAIPPDGVVECNSIGTGGSGGGVGGGGWNGKESGVEMGSRVEAAPDGSSYSSQSPRAPFLGSRGPAQRAATPPGPMLAGTEVGSGQKVKPVKSARFDLGDLEGTSRSDHQGEFPDKSVAGEVVEKDVRGRKNLKAKNTVASPTANPTPSPSPSPSRSPVRSQQHRKSNSPVRTVATGTADAGSRSGGVVVSEPVLVTMSPTHGAGVAQLVSPSIDSAPSPHHYSGGASSSPVPPSLLVPLSRSPSEQRMLQLLDAATTVAATSGGHNSSNNSSGPSTPPGPLKRTLSRRSSSRKFLQLQEDIEEGVMMLPDLIKNPPATLKDVGRKVKSKDVGKTICIPNIKNMGVRPIRSSISPQKDSATHFMYLRISTPFDGPEDRPYSILNVGKDHDAEIKRVRAARQDPQYIFVSSICIIHYK
jgi:hypothetical protein